MVSPDRLVALPALDAWRDGDARAVHVTDDGLTVAGVVDGTKERAAPVGIVWRCS